MIADQHLHLENGPYTPEDYPMSWVDAYLKKAEERGVDRLGIVEHAYRFRQAKGLLPNAWADGRCLFDLDVYLEFVERVRARGLPISFGLEMDYFPETEEGIGRFLEGRPWDFVLGSVHFIGDFGLDLPEERPRYDAIGGEDVWRRYFATSERAVRSGLFRVLTHPDLPKIFGERSPFDLSDSYRRLAGALREADMAIEINTAGLRKPVGEMYPHPDYVRAAHEAGVPLSLASDAHEPEHVGADFQSALRMAQEAGYTDTVHFIGGRRIQTPIAGA